MKSSDSTLTHQLYARFTLVINALFWTPLVWIYLTVPLLKESYLLFFGQLAEPADTINKHLGKWAMKMIVMNLWLGVLIALWRPLPLLLRKLAAHRRALGVASGMYLVLHVLFFYFREGTLDEVLKQIRQGKYLWFGIAAALIVLSMTVTSNNFSVRKLTHKKWKALHRFVYIAGLLIMFHMLLIEKSNPLETAAYFAPVIIAQAVRWFKKRTPQKAQTA